MIDAQREFQTGTYLLFIDSVEARTVRRALLVTAVIIFLAAATRAPLRSYCVLTAALVAPRTTPPGSTQAVRSRHKRQQDLLTNFPISSGDEKIMSARSPIIPAPTSAGASLVGPSSLESVLRRRLRSQNLRFFPSAVATS